MKLLQKFVLLCCAFGFVACGLANHLSSHRGVVISEADELLPSETAEDWRIYSDHLALVRLDSATRGAPSEEEVQAGEGFVPRTLHFAVDRVLWSRADAPGAPQELDLQVDGWTFKGDRETPLRFAGEPMLRVGGSYLMPLVFLAKGRMVDEPRWSDLSVKAILPVEDSVIGKGDELVGGTASRTQVVRGLWGQAPEAAAHLLTVTDLPPYARPYMDLPPTDRLTAITLAREKESG